MTSLVEVLLTAEQIAAFKEGEDILDDPTLFNRLYEFYLNNGEMPYGVAKARTGDPGQWLYDQLDRELN